MSNLLLKKYKQRLSKFCLFFCSLFVGLIFIEIYLRTFSSKDQIQHIFTQHSVNKKQKKITILCLGDSITYGQGLPTSYPNQLQTYLNYKSQDESKFRVINAGMPGVNSHFLLLQLEQFIEKLHPQVVLVMTGGNDLVENSFLGPQRKSTIFNKLRLWQLLNLMYLRNFKIPNQQKQFEQAQKEILQIKYPENRMNQTTKMTTQYNQQVLNDFNQATMAYRELKDDKLKMILLKKVKENILHFPFVYFIQNRWRLFQDIEIWTWLENIWQYAQPRNQDFWNLWQLLSLQKVPKDAVIELVALSKKYPQQLPSCNFVADELYQLGMGSLMNKLFLTNPNCFESQFQFLLNSRNFSVAKKLLDEKKISEEKKKYFTGLWHFYQGQISQSLAFLNDTVSSQGYFIKAQIYFNQKKYSQALHWINRAVSSLPGNSSFFGMRAEIKYQMNFIPEAIKDYKQAINLSPSKYSYYLDLAKLYFQIKDESLYEKTLWDGIDKSPTGKKIFLLELKKYYTARKNYFALEKITSVIAETEKKQSETNITKKNIISMFEKLKMKDISMVALSYPGDSALWLNKISNSLESQPFWVIDNQVIFENYEKKLGVDKIFADLNAGHMGHLTKLGAHILAKNVGDFLLQNRPWEQHHLHP